MYLMLSATILFAQEKKTVAIVEVIDRENKLTYAEKLMLRSNLARAVTNIEDYEAYNRADIDAILNEHNFQRSGNVSESDIKRIGEMTGAAYILITEGVVSKDNKIYVTAQIINVETTHIDVTDNKLIGTSSEEMLRGCRALASNMFGALAGVSTSANKFLNLFKAKPKSAEKQAHDSIVAANKAEQAAIVAAKKEEQRAQEDRIRKEQEEAKAKALRDRQLAEEKAREERKAQLEREKYYIKKINKNYVYLGKNMDQQAYVRFLQENCVEAYLQYNKGKKLIGAGWGLFAVGLAAVAGGSVCMALSAPNPSSSQSYTYVYNESTGNYEAVMTANTSDATYSLDLLGIIGVSAISVGSSMTVASIPILAVGYTKRNKAYQVYNAKCVSAPLSLNITAGYKGLGVALNF